MSNPCNNMEIYDFFNLNQALKKNILEGKYPLSLRYLKDFLNTKVSIFEYEGLPEPLTSQIVENMLLFNNRLCWYQDKILGTFLCRYVPDSDYDIYMKPKTVSLLGLNGVTIKTKVPYKDIVLCLDNTMDIIPFITILEYIYKMQEIENTLSIQIDWLKLPAVWSVPNKDCLSTIKRIIKKSENFEPFAVVDESVGSKFNQFDLKLPVEPESLIEIFKNYKNWCTESFGISGNASQKKERLLVGEVASQSDYSDTIYDDMKRNREIWIENVNKMFGTNIKLVERYQLRKKEEMKFQFNNMSFGGVNNERISKMHTDDETR